MAALFILALAVVLASCGGGDGGSNSSAPTSHVDPVFAPDEGTGGRRGRAASMAIKQNIPSTP